MKDKILLPLDGSEASLKAFIPAKSLAELLDMYLCILHISDDIISKDELTKKLCIHNKDTGCFILHHKAGNPIKEIINESENCRYIVMGSHGETEDKKRRMGNIAEQVAQKTCKPLLLIKPDSCLKIENNRWYPRKALIPLNGDPCTAQAFNPAVEIIAKTTSEIDLLHISKAGAQPKVEAGGLTTPYYEDYPQHEWGSWSEEFLMRFCSILDKRNGIKIRLSTAHGDPAEEIINFAKNNNNDFIVSAWHGTFVNNRAKVLKTLIFEISCPIMLIKIKP
jgi:nucleotide-binding universal stress UspA family protein